jgi:hypothetical protein
MAHHIKLLPAGASTGLVALPSDLAQVVLQQIMTRVVPSASRCLVWLAAVNDTCMMPALEQP